MDPFAVGEGFTIYYGDCLAVMASLPESSVDAIVCDPPYGLTQDKKGGSGVASVNLASPYGRARVTTGNGPGGFMGKAWDAKVPGPEVWAEALRVAKPGAHLVAFGGTRTFHRLTCAIEDGGWEIRDCLSWLYGSGFPKSLDVAKALDRAAGIPREDKFEDSFDRRSGPTGNRKCDACGKWIVSGDPCRCPRPQDAPQSEAAKKWAGWGTALKPAWEPIVLARKPLQGTVAANVQKHGTGGLNIDGCRIGTEERTYTPKGIAPGQNNAVGKEWDGGGQPPRAVEGRWPANVALDEEAARLLDEQAGDRGGGAPASGPTLTGRSESVARGSFEGTEATPFYGDSGGPSRFFFTAKASRSEREEGLENFAPAIRGDGRKALDGPGANNPRLRTSARKNDHPTVKPIDLMRWLVRLVAPPGGLILDPFMGSGSTLKAAREEFHPCIGIDMTERYCAIAKARLSANTLPLT